MLPIDQMSLCIVIVFANYRVQTKHSVHDAIVTHSFLIDNFRSLRRQWAPVLLSEHQLYQADRHDVPVRRLP